MTTSTITRRVASPLEKEIEKKIGLHAKKVGVLYRKYTSPSNRAVPDRQILAHGGVTGFLELKRKGEKPTPLQWRELRTLKEMGFNVGWCDNVRDGCTFIDLLLQRNGTQIVMGEGL